MAAYFGLSQLSQIAPMDTIDGIRINIVLEHLFRDVAGDVHDGLVVRPALGQPRDEGVSVSELSQRWLKVECKEVCDTSKDRIEMT